LNRKRLKIEVHGQASENAKKFTRGFKPQTEAVTRQIWPVNASYQKLNNLYLKNWKGLQKAADH